MILPFDGFFKAFTPLNSNSLLGVGLFLMTGGTQDSEVGYVAEQARNESIKIYKSNFRIDYWNDMVDFNILPHMPLTTG
jgi:hypothetical protein